MKRRPPVLWLVMLLSVVIGLHAYVGLSLIPDLNLPGWGLILAWFVVVLSTVTMPMAMLAPRASHPWLADVIAWVGMFCMGLFSSLLVLSLARDIALLIVDWLDQRAHWAAASAWWVVFAAGVMSVWGLWNARRRARIVQVDIPVAGLPKDLHGFRIAQITDIHVGPTIKHGYLRRIVEAVNALEADAVAITGDLVDGSVKRLQAHTAPLARLQARHGAYFVTGNHEYYSGAHGWIEEVKRLGITVLMNEHVTLSHAGATVVLAGVTDFTAHHFDPSHQSDPVAALQGAPADAGVRVLLAHQPRSAPAAEAAGFDVQLSGHTHGGQFYPWNLFVPMQQPWVAGLKRLGKLWVYTSRGTGYWGPPKRFGAPSEITCIRLVSAK